MGSLEEDESRELSCHRDQGGHEEVTVSSAAGRQESLRAKKRPLDLVPRELWGNVCRNFGSVRRWSANQAAGQNQAGSFQEQTPKPPTEHFSLNWSGAPRGVLVLF